MRDLPVDGITVSGIHFFELKAIVHLRKCTRKLCDTV